MGRKKRQVFFWWEWKSPWKIIEALCPQMISIWNMQKIFCRMGILRNVCPRPIIDLILELELILFCSRRKVKKSGKEQTKTKTVKRKMIWKMIYGEKWVENRKTNRETKKIEKQINAKIVNNYRTWERWYLVKDAEQKENGGKESQFILHATGNLLTMHVGENNQDILNWFCVTWVSP